jgi:VanZ family protein
VLPEFNSMRTGLPGRLEHFIAYAGSAAVAMAGYGPSWGGVRVIGSIWVYAAILEFLQHFSPGRHPALFDFAASALGALFFAVPGSSRLDLGVRDVDDHAVGA